MRRPSAPAPSAAAGANARPSPQQANASDGAAEQAVVLPAADGLLSLGEIISLMMRSTHFRTLPLAAISALIGPAFSCGQYVIARAKNEAGAQVPVGACVWACVSNDVDRRLSENLRQAHAACARRLEERRHPLGGRSAWRSARGRTHAAAIAESHAQGTFHEAAHARSGRRFGRAYIDA